jgi:hypothetical protein
LDLIDIYAMQDQQRISLDVHALPKQLSEDERKLLSTTTLTTTTTITITTTTSENISPAR